MATLAGARGQPRCKDSAPISGSISLNKDTTVPGAVGLSVRSVRSCSVADSARSDLSTSIAVSNDAGLVNPLINFKQQSRWSRPAGNGFTVRSRCQERCETRLYRAGHHYYGSSREEQATSHESPPAASNARITFCRSASTPVVLANEHHSRCAPTRISDQSRWNREHRVLSRLLHARSNPSAMSVSCRGRPAASRVARDTPATLKHCQSGCHQRCATDGDRLALAARKAAAPAPKAIHAGFVGTAGLVQQLRTA